MLLLLGLSLLATACNASPRISHPAFQRASLSNLANGWNNQWNSWQAQAAAQQRAAQMQAARSAYLNRIFHH
jgi:hypothetical protein